VSRVDDISIAITRPTDIKRLVDFMLGAWPDAPKVDRERIGLFGHSRGGYTGLVAVGGHPNFRKAAARCAEGSSPGSPCESFTAPRRPSYCIDVLDAVKGLMPLRSFVAGFLMTTNFANPGTKKGSRLLEFFVAYFRERAPRLPPAVADFFFADSSLGRGMGLGRSGRAWLATARVGLTGVCSL
jgi:pimeloyl-ACP methyl ester carboxylesterase